MEALRCVPLIFHAIFNEYMVCLQFKCADDNDDDETVDSDVHYINNILNGQFASGFHANNANVEY